MVGNPANTNALILSANAPDIPKTQITAMTRLDQNRAVALLAQKLEIGVDEVCDLVVWGNHSPSMFPDLFNATAGGKPAIDLVDMDWYENTYIPRVGKRGAEVIEARGASSAASAANAAIDHVRDWVAGADGLRSMAVASDGSYGVAEGIVSSFPVRVSGGSYEIVRGPRRRGVRAGEDRCDGQGAHRRARGGGAARAGVISRARRPGVRSNGNLTPAIVLSPLRRFLRVPAPSVLRDEAVLGQSRQYAVEVVLLDAHLLGELGDRDPGALLDERQCLGAARAAALGAAAATGAVGAATLG